MIKRGLILFLLLKVGGLLGQTDRVLMPPRNNSPGFETTTATCEADFFDSGGTDPYGNDENGILTLCPNIEGDRVEIVFLTADIKANDFLRVYDGDSDSAPLLATITNTVSSIFEETVVRATQRNPEGCLTVTFTSIPSTVANPYQGWFARISCFTPEIEPGKPQDLFRNDDPSGDGVEVFDLRENTGEVLNGLSPTDFEVTYYANENDALNGANPLNTTHTNQGNPQTIYSRLENPTTGYIALDQFRIFVNPIPVVVPVPDLVRCDVDADGVAVFRLDDASVDIRNGRENLRIYYYNALENALADRERLNPESYAIEGNPQTIHYRLIDLDTGAFAIGTFDLRLTDPPALNRNLQVLSCGEGEGMATQDLNAVAQELTGSGSNIEVTWHLTPPEAEVGENPLPNNFSVRENTTLYARAIQTGTNCAAIANVSFLFYPEPDNLLDEAYFLCPEDVNPEVVLQTGLPEERYTFRWLLNDVVIPGANRPFLETGEKGQIEVLIDDLVTGCVFRKTTVVKPAVPPSDFEITYRPETFGNSYEVTVETDENIPYFYSLDGNPAQESPVFKDVLPGSHRLQITTNGGCLLQTTDFEVLGYPTFFTPNGDNINETWAVSSSREISGMRVYIFNRFGALLTVLTESQPNWDGTLQGRDLPSDTYWFRAEYREDQELKTAKGYFALKR